MDIGKGDPPFSFGITTKPFIPSSSIYFALKREEEQKRKKKGKRRKEEKRKRKEKGRKGRKKRESIPSHFAHHSANLKVFLIA
jgi:CRISPR/Cas system CMR subunit Cmr4 (Cas7 group RAMP superfamily)